MLLPLIVELTIVFVLFVIVVVAFVSLAIDVVLALYVLLTKVVEEVIFVSG